MDFTLLEIYGVLAIGTAIGGTFKLRDQVFDNNSLKSAIQDATTLLGKWRVLGIFVLVVTICSALWPLSWAAWIRSYLKKDKTK